MWVLGTMIVVIGILLILAYIAEHDKGDKDDDAMA